MRLRTLLRRFRAWLLAPAHDPAPYIALTAAILLTRMTSHPGGPHGNRDQF